MPSPIVHFELLGLVGAPTYKALALVYRLSPATRLQPFPVGDHEALLRAYDFVDVSDDSLAEAVCYKAYFDGGSDTLYISRVMPPAEGVYHEPDYS